MAKAAHVELKSGLPLFGSSLHTRYTLFGDGISLTVANAAQVELNSGRVEAPGQWLINDKTWDDGNHNEIKRIAAAPIFGEVDAWQGPNIISHFNSTIALNRQLPWSNNSRTEITATLRAPRPRLRSPVPRKRCFQW